MLSRVRLCFCFQSSPTEQGEGDGSLRSPCQALPSQQHHLVTTADTVHHEIPSWTKPAYKRWFTPNKGCKRHGTAGWCPLSLLSQVRSVPFAVPTPKSCAGRVARRSLLSTLSRTSTTKPGQPHPSRWAWIWQPLTRSGGAWNTGWTSEPSSGRKKVNFLWI